MRRTNRFRVLIPIRPERRTISIKGDQEGGHLVHVTLLHSM